MDGLGVLVLAVLLAEASGHECYCTDHPETGLRNEKLFVYTKYPYESRSQCAAPSHCDNSTPGTGHKLFSDLTEDLIAVERCYSFCYTNVTRGVREGNATLFPDDIFAGPACSGSWKEGHVCFSACLFALRSESVFDPDDPISSLVSESNLTCSDFCTMPGGICERAFPPDIDSGCIQQCQNETCPRYCQLVEASFPQQSSADAITYSGEFALTLNYTSNVILKKDGVLEFRIDYSPPPLNSTLAPGVAYGLIWQVTYNGSHEDGRTVKRYIPQHLPFILLPDEVGSLYRIGSNMLAIRDLQCRQNVQLAFALVNKHGIGPFSMMQTQCFYGSWFPIPPNNITIKLGFDYFTGGLRLEIASHDLSPDQEYVEGYRLLVLSEPLPSIEKNSGTCNSELGDTQTIQTDVAFDSKDNLSLIVCGTEEVKKFFPLFTDGCSYLIGVYALPQRNRSATKDDSRLPVANWKEVFVFLPDYAKIQGSSTREVFPDPITGKYNVTFAYNVTSHWSSLAVTKYVYGQLIKVRDNELTVPKPNYFTALLPVTPSQTVYHFHFQDIPPLRKQERYMFERMYKYRYTDVSFDVSDNEFFNLTARSPSAVRNLTAIVNFEESKSKIIANVSWIGPETPYGNISHYVVVLSSPKAATITKETRVVMNTAAATDMTVLLEIQIVADLLEDDHFNFSVHAVSEWEADGVVEIFQTAQPSHAAVFYNIEPYLIGIIAAIGLLLVVSLLIVGAIGCFCCRRKKAVMGKLQQWEVERTLSILRTASASSSDDWEVDPNHVFMKEKLGEGSFGEVYRAHITKGIDCARAKRYVEDMTCKNKTATSCTVAVKLLKANAPGETLQSFLNEINMMKKVAHGDNTHIVKMVGCVSSQSPYALILEYVPYGSLLDYLKENRKLTHKRIKLKRAMQLAMGSCDEAKTTGRMNDRQLEQNNAFPYLEPVQLSAPKVSNLLPSHPQDYIQPLPSLSPVQRPSSETGTRVCSMAMNPLYEEPELQELYVDLGELEAVNLMTFAYQIASGMEYLASLGIVHRDLACRNVLVDRKKNLKISDFGLSRETDLYVCSTQGKLPLRWMSPEAITERIFTEQSDVWAYGVTVWEICTLGGFPYATLPNQELLPNLVKGYRMESPDNCSEEIYRIMLDCWHMEPEERPSFKQLRSNLDSLLAIHQAHAYINFSLIDVDKLPYYEQDSSSAKGEGSNEGPWLLIQPEVFDSDTGTCTLASMRSASRATTESKTLAVAFQGGSTHEEVPISPPSCARTIENDDETQKNGHDGGENVKPSGTGLTAHDSASTIRDDSGDEETEV